MQVVPQKFYLRVDAKQRVLSRCGHGSGEKSCTTAAVQFIFAIPHRGHQASERAEFKLQKKWQLPGNLWRYKIRIYSEKQHPDSTTLESPNEIRELAGSFLDSWKINLWLLLFARNRQQKDENWNSAIQSGCLARLHHVGGEYFPGITVVPRTHSAVSLHCSLSCLTVC